MVCFKRIESTEAVLIPTEYGSKVATVGRVGD